MLPLRFFLILFVNIGIAVFIPGQAIAKSQLVTVEGVEYDVNATMGTNLKQLLGKKVTVTLNSGNSMSGYIKALGPKLLHLEKLQEKDFFDALIRLEHIRAIETQFREYYR